jgi:hypothetical protein
LIFPPRSCETTIHYGMVIKKSFTARRVPRVIGQEEDESADSAENSEQGAPSTSSKGTPPDLESYFPTRVANDIPEDSPVVRPALNKPKKRSALRLSFGPDEASAGNAGEGSDEEAVRKVVRPPKKLGPGRTSLGKKAELRGLATSEDLPFRAGLEEDRPSYSKAYLDELKQSTPATPKKEFSPAPKDGDDGSKAIDVASKFGPQAFERASAIPSEAEIKEKKERRARLAKEKEYISFEPNSDDDIDQNQLSDEDARQIMRRTGAYMEDKYDNPESRLVRDNEDFAEGFEEYVEDGKMSLGRKAQREAAVKRRAEMAAMIDQAEGGSPKEDSSDSEAERNAAYEAAQARAGTYGAKKRSAGGARDGIPPKLRPIPDLGSVAATLKRRLEKMKEAQAVKLRRLEQIKVEKKEIAEREAWIQTQLKETAERYDRLRVEAGMASGALTPINGDGPKMLMDRGLETLGATPTGGLSDEEDEGHRGLGA